MTERIATSTRHRTARIIAAAIVIGIFIAIVSSVSSHGGGGPYSAQVTSVTPLQGPGNYVRVDYTVTNAGSASGSPSCQIDIQLNDVNGNPMASGSDAMSGTNTVPAHGSQAFYADIVVTNNDAFYVTNPSMVTISGC
jgi:hypothetical protein